MISTDMAYDFRERIFRLLTYNYTVRVKTFREYTQQVIKYAKFIANTLI